MKTGVLSRYVPYVLVVSAMAAFPVVADEDLKANLSGYNEVPPTSSPGTAQFRADINKDETEITYEVSYSGFVNTVTQSHLHFGKRAINGGIMVFVCSNLGNGPAGTPLCPASPATVTGTWTAASVVGPAAQGIAPGEFAEVVAAIRNHAAYANIHTNVFPAGEIRDQVKDRRDHHDHDHDGDHDGH